MQSSLFLLAFAALAASRTDLSGCVSSETVAYGGASLIWYVPGSGEICAFVDCGGGAGAPVTTNPGCPLYSGTATYSPSYLSGYAAGSGPATSTTHAVSTTTALSTAMITGSSSTSVEASQQIGTTVTSTRSEIKSSEVSSGLTTSVTGTSTKSASSSSNGTTITKSSSTTIASVSSLVGNSGVSNGVDVVQGFVVIVAAGFTFLL